MYGAQKIVWKDSILVENSLKTSPPLAKNMSDKANAATGLGPRTRSQKAKDSKDKAAEAAEAIPAPAATPATNASDVTLESETLVRKSVVAAAVAAESAKNEKKIKQLQAKLKQFEEEAQGDPPPEGATAEPTAPRNDAPVAPKRRLLPTPELPTTSDTELDSEEEAEQAPRRKKLNPTAKPFPQMAAPRPPSKPTPSAPRLAPTERKPADEVSYEDLKLPKPPSAVRAVVDAFGDGGAAIIPANTVVMLGLYNLGKGATLTTLQIARLLRDSRFTGSDQEFLSRVVSAKWIKEGFVVMFNCPIDRNGFLSSLGERLKDPNFNNKFRPIRYYGRNVTVRPWEERTEFKDHYRLGNGNRSWERGDRGGGNGGFGGRF